MPNDKSTKPTVFLGGSVKPDWRTPIIAKFTDLTFYNPVKADYDPVKDIYEEIAEMLKADYIVFYLGGEQTALEKELLEKIGVPYKEYDDLDKLETALLEIKEGNWGDKDTLEEGTVVKVEGVPFQLVQDTKISGSEGNFEIIKEALDDREASASSSSTNLMEDVHSITSALLSEASAIDKDRGFIAPDGEIINLPLGVSHSWYTAETILGRNPKEDKDVDASDSSHSGALMEAYRMGYVRWYAMGTWLNMTATVEGIDVAIPFIKEKLEEGFIVFIDFADDFLEGQSIHNKVELGAFLREVNEKGGTAVKIASASVNSYDIQATARELNDKYFEGKLDLGFEMRYGNIARDLGKVKATRLGDKAEVTELVISGKYRMDSSLFEKIMAHELIHVKLLQERAGYDFGGAHGVFFQAEVDRIKGMGLDVPLSEDLPEGIEYTSEELKTPVYAIIKNKEWIKPYKAYEDKDINEYLYSVVAYNLKLKGEAEATLEFIKTTNGLITKYPISREFKTLRLKEYKLEGGDYEVLAKDIYDTKVVTPSMFDKLEKRYLK
jgi:hypothetical protein